MTALLVIPLLTRGVNSVGVMPNMSVRYYLFNRFTSLTEIFLSHETLPKHSLITFHKISVVVIDILGLSLL